MESKNWIKRVIYYQEKKQYHLYTILIFVIFVGTTRTLEEVMLAHRRYSALDVINNCVFYFLMAWGFAFVLSLLSKVPWQKVIIPVLIGVFLGLFPPLIDVFVYGIGNFKYTYHTGGISPQTLVLFNPSGGFPAGEGVVLWSTIFFACYYIYLKTKKIWRTVSGGILVYTLVLMVGGVFIPSLALSISRDLALPVMSTISILQVLLITVIFMVLNPKLSRRLAVRGLHCIPFVLLCFLGSALTGKIDKTTVLMGILVYLAGITSLVQNDYFDREEDEISGRNRFVSYQDVLFFNSIYAIIIVSLCFAKSLIFLTPLILFVCSVLYNYDFYRGKKFFPGNYKIEGIWGLASFISGMLYKGAHVFTPEVNIYCFLVFGGWSIVTTFKDYKDIDADRAVGNQTGYLMLMRTGMSLEKSHAIVRSVILSCMMVPVVWLLFKDVPRLVTLIFAAFTLIPAYRSMKGVPCADTVKKILVSVSVYLFVLLVILLVYPVAVPEMR